MSDSVKVQTVVRTDPRTAFRVFTDDVGVWWKRRASDPDGAGTLRFADGKLMEGTFEIGRVLSWEPGVRLVFEWRTRAFAPGEKTEVEIGFAAEGEGTRITLVHRGWSSLRDDHPARHGFRPQAGRAFADMIGLSWAEQLTSYRGRF